MARKQYKYHYIYKTVCKVTGKYYVGMHSTSNLDDDYIGSGKRLWYSINKHGRENHEKEILEYLPDRRSLRERERELVNESMIQDPMCMNLSVGGEGGFLNRESAAAGGRVTGRRNRESARNKFQEKLKSDSNFKSKWIENVGKSLFKKTGSVNGWKGRKHSQDTIEKMKKKRQDFQKGEKNSQYGTVWIQKKNECKKIKREEFNVFLSHGWKLGRKIKSKSDGKFERKNRNVD